MERMKIIEKNDVAPGRFLESHLCLDHFFIVLSRYTTVSQRDLNLIESHDLFRMVPAANGAGQPPVAEPASASHERGRGDEPGRTQAADSSTLPEELVPEGSPDQAAEDSRAGYDDILKLLYRELLGITRGSTPNQERFFKTASSICSYASDARDESLARVSRGCARNKTVRHLVHTGILSALIGEAVGKGGEELALLVAGALLHDVGMLLLAEQGAAGDIRRHTVEGHRYLQEADMHPRIAAPALQHHETANGTGYPRGIRLEDMSEESRIVALCDNWNNQLNLVKYGWDPALHYSRREFLKWRADDYDRRLIRTFFALLGTRAARGGRVQLSDGRWAEIQGVSQRFPLNPVVRTEEGETVDLRKEKRCWIGGAEQ